MTDQAAETRDLVTLAATLQLAWRARTILNTAERWSHASDVTRHVDRARKILAAAETMAAARTATAANLGQLDAARDLYRQVLDGLDDPFRFTQMWPDGYVLEEFDGWRQMAITTPAGRAVITVIEDTGEHEIETSFGRSIAHGYAKSADKAMQLLVDMVDQRKRAASQEDPR